MALLLDTHTILWFDAGSKRIGPGARRAIERALASDVVQISAITFWEMRLLQKYGRIDLTTPVATFRRNLLRSGYQELSIDGELATAAVDLDWSHRDPADRFLVATARVHGATLVTADQSILAWPGDLERLDARE